MSNENPTGDNPDMEYSDEKSWEIAKKLKAAYDIDLKLQKEARESEFYRYIMYSLLPEAEEIDGTSRYWKIVRFLESLFVNEPPIEDWND